MPALVQDAVGAAALPADLVTLRAARAAGSITELLDAGGAGTRLPQYRSILAKYALVYKHALDGWCCSCAAFLRDAVCVHERTWRALLRLAAPPNAVAQLAGGVRGRPAAGTARAQAGADSRIARTRRTAAATDAPAAAAAAAAVAAADLAERPEADVEADPELAAEAAAFAAPDQ